MSEIVIDRLATIIPETAEQAARPRPFVDAHVHLMRTALYPWFNRSKALTFEGPWDPLFDQGDFLAADLKAETAGSPVELVGAVHVQANAVDPVAEVEQVEADCAAAGLPVAIVAGGDLSAPDIEPLLEREAAHDRVRGFRQNLNIHDHPLYHYVDKPYMDDPDWLHGLGLLAKQGMSFDMQLYPTQFGRACEVIDEHPDTLFILNHAGMWADRNFAGWKLWRDGLVELGRRDNCVVKISGLASMDHRWTLESIKPAVFTVLDAFGLERTMFASNFPVEKLHGSYADIVHGFARCVEDFEPAERDALFVGNARRWYRF